MFPIKDSLPSIVDTWPTNKATADQRLILCRGRTGMVLNVKGADVILEHTHAYKTCKVVYVSNVV